MANVVRQSIFVISALLLCGALFIWNTANIDLQALQSLHVQYAAHAELQVLDDKLVRLESAKVEVQAELGLLRKTNEGLQASNDNLQQRLAYLESRLGSATPSPPMEPPVQESLAEELSAEPSPTLPSFEPSHAEPSSAGPYPAKPSPAMPSSAELLQNHLLQNQHLQNHLLQNQPLSADPPLAEPKLAEPSTAEPRSPFSEPTRAEPSTAEPLKVEEAHQISASARAAAPTQKPGGPKPTFRGIVNGPLWELQRYLQKWSTKEPPRTYPDWSERQGEPGKKVGRKMSATCKCALEGKCNGPAPIRRFNITDSDLLCSGNLDCRFDYEYGRKNWTAANLACGGRRRSSPMPPSWICTNTQTTEKTENNATKAERTSTQANQSKKVERVRRRQDKGYCQKKCVNPAEEHGKEISELRIPSVCKLRGRQVIYFTYDDGIWCEEPTCGRAYDFLDMADWLGVKVTVFVVTRRFTNWKGNGRRHHPEAALKALAEYERRGHVIGSHTSWHPNLATEAFDVAAKSICDADAWLQNFSSSGRRPVHFRAPHLAHSERILDFLVRCMGYRTWGGVNGGGTDHSSWEISSKHRYTWAQQYARIVRNALRYQEGSELSVVLTMHDRPHVLRFFKEYVVAICRECPSCEFKGLSTKCM